MIRALIDRIVCAVVQECRVLRALCWLTLLRETPPRVRPAGLEDLFARPDPLLTVPSLDPAEVGRQASRGAAILDVVRWLDCQGWYGEDRGEVQRYACWLLERRAAYERGSAVRP